MLLLAWLIPVDIAAKLIALALNLCASVNVEFNAFLNPFASLARFLNPLPSPSSLNVIDMVLLPAIVVSYYIVVSNFFAISSILLRRCSAVICLARSEERRVG